ncbi:DPP IV N-terminal domain-containing protein, partial [Bacteroidota bacterium]
NLMLFTVAILISSLTGITTAQDRLPNMPGYDQYQEMSPKIRSSVIMGSVRVTWAEDGKSFDYNFNGKKYHYDIKKNKKEVVGDVEARSGQQRFSRRNTGGTGERVQRGRQYTIAMSPDGKLKAFYKDNNLWLSNPDGSNVQAITTEGKDKIRYGTATWVYGEELGQQHAIWWSPDNKKIAYYRFDLSKIKDYYVLYKQTELQDSIEAEAYIKVGCENPFVELYIYDLETKKKVNLEVRLKPFGNYDVGEYIYAINWSPNGKELLFHRTNRKQDIMEWCAADPVSGKCRIIIHEEWLPSYTKNNPPVRYLEDNYRFVWTSERNGFKNYYLYDLSGKLHATLTNHQFEVSNIVRIDEKAGFMYYMARSGDNHMKLQLHRVGLDGKGDILLTNPAFNHSVNISPDGKYFIDIAQTHNIPPVSTLVETEKGKVLAELEKSDMTKFNELGLKTVEMVTYKATDGVTVLYGMLHFPSNFDPNKKYPVLVSVYGGPETNAARETFTLPNARTEYGFLCAGFDSRTAAGRGKRFMDPTYGNLIKLEIADQAEGVKSLWNRPYFNKDRVGIYGTSYGGTSSAGGILQHPDVYQAACANSAVTDFRLYDDIYTERFNGLLTTNLAGYEAGSLMNYAENLKGDLMIFYGTQDNNVHPSNSLQLIKALQRAGKYFQVQVGPDVGHAGLNANRMMEFFIESLVLK